MSRRQGEAIKQEVEQARLLEESLAAASIINSFIRSCISQRELSQSDMETRNIKLSALKQIFDYDESLVDTFFHSTLLIQRVVRGYNVRAKLFEANYAAGIIQYNWKRYLISLRSRLLHVFDSLNERDSMPQSISHVARTLLPRDSRSLNRMREVAPYLPQHHECGVFVEEILNAVTLVIQCAVRRYLARQMIHKLILEIQVSPEKSTQMRFPSDDEIEVYVLAPIYKRAEINVDKICRLQH
jgi:hypothetical protein